MLRIVVPCAEEDGCNFSFCFLPSIQHMRLVVVNTHKYWRRWFPSEMSSKLSIFNLKTKVYTNECAINTDRFPIVRVLLRLAYMYMSQPNEEIIVAHLTLFNNNI